MVEQNVFVFALVDQKGEKLFFDLDILIQHDIIPIEAFEPEDCLGIVKTWWHDIERMREETKHVPHKFSDINSSVLRWNDNFDSAKLWEYFNKYKQQILWQYRGIDNFLCDKNIVPMKMFPLGWVYSFNQGYIYPQDTKSLCIVKCHISVYLTLWVKVKMLKSNFLNNFKFYGEASYFIEQKAPQNLPTYVNVNYANDVELQHGS